MKTEISKAKTRHLTPALSPIEAERVASAPCVSRGGFADMLDVSVRTVDRMIAAKEIPVHRVRGKVVRFLRSDVEAYLGEKRKAESEKETSLPHPGPLPPAAAGRRGSRDAKGGSL